MESALDMKSDSERQKEYQKRRTETETRITFWMGKEIEQLCDALRGNESRAMWLNRAVSELIYRQLVGKSFDDLYTDAELSRAQRSARKLGVELPD